VAEAKKNNQITEKEEAPKQLEPKQPAA